MSAQAATEVEPEPRPDRHLSLVVGRPGRVHLDRARRHTKGSLRALERAQRAHLRRHGLGPGEMPEDLAAQLPCWSSRRQMLRIIGWLATQRRTRELCKASGGLALATWRAIMINDVLDADSRTGHGVGTSQLVAGTDVGRCEKQVQRARRVSVQLGIMVEYFRGYQLSGDQRVELLEMSPGNEQKGIPNVYAMAVCPPRQRSRISVPRPAEFALVEANVHLPLCTYFGLPTYLPGPLPIADADAPDATDGPSGRLPRRKRRPGWPLAHELLALPGMKIFAGVPEYKIDRQLEPYRAGGWHGTELGEHLIRIATELKWDVTRRAWNPPGALKTLLSHVDPIRDVVLGEPPAPPKPCGRPGCDNGWIQVRGVGGSLADVADFIIQTATDRDWVTTRPAWKPAEVLRTLLIPGRRDTNTVAKCPHCPPGVREPARVEPLDAVTDEPPW